MNNEINILFSYIRRVLSAQILSVFALFFANGLCPAALVAQEIIFSRAQQLSNRADEYDLCGRTNDEGIIIHSWGDNYSQIEAYDEATLARKWAKPVFFERKRKTKMRNVSVFGDNALLLTYTLKASKMNYLYVRITDSRLNPLTNDVLLDSIRTTINSPSYRIEVSLSPDRKLALISRHNFEFNNIISTANIIIDQELHVLLRRKYVFDNKKTFFQEFIDNSGQLTTLSVQAKNTMANDDSNMQIEALYLEVANAYNDRKISIEKNDVYLTDFRVASDLRNRRIVLAGFYNEKKAAKRSKGYFYGYIDQQSDTLSYYTMQPFQPDLLKQAGNSLLVAKDQLANLKTINMLVRQDGGILLMSESAYSTRQTAPRSNFDGFSGRQFAQITNFYNNDIVLLSINPDGSELWSKILPKRQYSEDDNAYYSSFAALNDRTAMYLFFNEEIRNSTNVAFGQVDAIGNYKISVMRNTGQNSNILLAPRYAKQLWPNALLVPGFNNKNEFLIAKILIK